MTLDNPRAVHNDADMSSAPHEILFYAACAIALTPLFLAMFGGYGDDE